ncbi:MAG: HlyD family efflux transporter periplasmic adaptor subunit [Clostridiales bacterium]|nr:HlyD family efflux transporter periplasmic adaptor subunit [Clostridiales bacterium]MDO4349656.1 HlyD family efflux transporter periplasmic adaptor subunit [Eubacteriales bacterium]MDY4009064.1 HlyD family efflux transporter periplasmic adaptor subunit [Candidatus Limiplasma sp.]
MKKLVKVLLALILLGAGGYFGWRYYQAHSVAAVQAVSQSAYTEYAIGRGSLSKTVTGTGTLSISQTEDIAPNYAITVTRTLADVGDTVAAGDALMTIDTDALRTAAATLEAELDETESEITSITSGYSSTAYIRMPQYARIKEVYIEPGQYIQDVMAEKGCIALASLDGWMYVETPAQEGMEIGSTVSVRVERATLEGTVRGLENGTATITFSDAYGAEGQEVTLTYNKQSLGAAVAHIHMPYRLTTSEKGYISAVYMQPNDRKWENNRICYLINVPVSDDYAALCATRDKQAARLAEMKALMASGCICAPEDGIVASIAQASVNEQAAGTVLASLYVSEEKEMVVTVDELDIINVQPGQDVEIAMDAITDKTYSGKVSKVSQIGTATSGVTVYDVTLSVEGDSQLKLGMNGTATIRIQEVTDVLLAPITALNSSRGSSYVWLKSSDAQTDEPGLRVEVETGLSDENYVEILSGLSEGDVVLITREASVSTSSRDEKMDGGMLFDMGGGLPGAGGNPGGNGGGAPSGNPGGNGGGRRGN